MKNMKHEYQFKDKSYSLEIKERMQYMDEYEMIIGVADGLFDNGEYCPERFDYFFWAYAIMKYTDFNTVTEMSVDDFVEFIDSTTIMRDIAEGVNQNQYNRIVRCVEKRVDVRINRNPLTDVITMLKNVYDNLEDGIDTIKNSDTVKRVLDKDSEFKVDALSSIVDLFKKKDE